MEAGKMPEPKPNVIVIITDDQGYGDLGCHGNPVARTPNLDTLHDQSVRFGDFHAAPMCTPTRGQLLTGLDAARNGAVNVSSGRTLLRADLKTMADLFRDSGYRTGLFGKWHLGDNYPYRPQDRGFEQSLWFPSSHISSLPDYWLNDYFDDVYCRNGVRERVQGYCTEVFFREARSWMQSCVRGREPFFCYLPTNAPHYPLYVPAEDRKAIETAFAENEHLLPELTPDKRTAIIRFLAMIRTVDTEVGRLREFLEAQDVARNTIVVFMTDNGSTFGPAYYNSGMKGGKCTLWEGGHRVPCFIHWHDGNLGEPRDIDGLTQMQDLLPTLAELCGLSLPDTPLDGISLAAALRGGTVPADRMLCVNYSRMPSFDYPTPASQAVMRREGAAVMWKRWRLLEGTALYDLDADPGQEHNVIEQHPEIAATMAGALDRWWRDVEPVANQPQEITVGSNRENPMMLSACEWWDVFLDQQFQVRHGCHKNSYWHLKVERAGTYRFELRRWPRESALALRDASPAAQLTDGDVEEGVALSISRARLTVGGRSLRHETAAEDQAAVFTLDLREGSTLLHTWFDDERGEPICGAYYVYVERLD
jgi:arylsulfatase